MERQNTLLQKVMEPKVSLTVMVVGAAFYTMNRTVVGQAVILVLALFAAALAIVRCCMARKSGKANLILYIFEVLGLLLFSGIYVLLYNKTVEGTEINILFLLCSTILLFPVIVEIGLQAKNASEKEPKQK